MDVLEEGNKTVLYPACHWFLQAVKTLSLCLGWLYTAVRFSAVQSSHPYRATLLFGNLLAFQIPAAPIHIGHQAGFPSLPGYSISFPVSQPFSSVGLFWPVFELITDTYFASSFDIPFYMAWFSPMSQFSDSSPVSMRKSWLIKHSTIDCSIDCIEAGRPVRMLQSKPSRDLFRWPLMFQKTLFHPREPIWLIQNSFRTTVLSAFLTGFLSEWRTDFSPLLFLLSSLETIDLFLAIVLAIQQMEHPCAEYLSISSHSCKVRCL